MKTLKIFGWLSHFLWASMMVLSVFFGMLVYSDFKHTNHQTWLIEFMGKEIPVENNTIYFRTFLIISYLVYLLYFYAVFLFNLCVRQFEKRLFFDDKIISRFKKIGFVFVASYIAVFLLGKLFTIHSERVITSSTNLSERIISELKAPLGGLIIGFFFLVLSQVFKEAKKQKEENELTI